jgi:mannitol/fructose-specific phosphotransferase system IIA component (Ntr-type)
VRIIRIIGPALVETGRVTNLKYDDREMIDRRKASSSTVILKQVVKSA